MNYQNCARVMFVGLSDSFEQIYQGIRRCWRFGQTRPVDVYFVAAASEGNVVRNIEEKERAFAAMGAGMAVHMRDLTRRAVRGEGSDGAGRSAPTSGDADMDAMTHSDEWTLFNEDCVAVTRNIPDGALHYTIFSPPFESLFTFSDDPRDMSNCSDSETFWTHFRFLIAELYRATMPGRLCSITACSCQHRSCGTGSSGCGIFAAR